MTLVTLVVTVRASPEWAPKIKVKIFKDGQKRYGDREWSPNIVRRLEERCGEKLLAPGFPSEIEDDEPEVAGEEVKVRK